MIKQRVGPDVFSFFLSEDEGRTGRLEVTVYRNQSRSIEGDGQLVFSKKQTGEYPSQNWDSFIEQVQAAINW